MRVWLFIAALGLGVSNGACAYETIDQYPCPQGGTALTYDNFGRGFMTRYCSSCHSEETPNRMGAPGEFIFDTVDQVQRHRDRIFVRAAATNDSMPPGPYDPPAAERNQLAEWLACGAP